MPSAALIIGCGYIGLPLALHLRATREVHGWVHSETGARALENQGFSRIIVGSVADPRIWEQVPTSYDLVIHCASSSRGGEAAYEEVFSRGIAQIITHLPNVRKLMISSTSVYGQADGETVTEDSPAEPMTATGKILRQAEESALAGGVTVVRASGIYGPNRAVLWNKLQRGDAVIEGDGQRWINQIHQADLVAALAHLVEVGNPGEVYNATDDTPVPQRDFYAWCASFLGKPLPPTGPVNTQRKRGLSNKRVSNAKLRATGWRPLYPSFTDWFRVAPPAAT